MSQNWEGIEKMAGKELANKQICKLLLELTSTFANEKSTFG